MSGERPELSAFEELVRAAEGPVRVFIAMRGVPLTDVDDLAQEVFVDYFRNQERRPPEVEPLRWLKGMAKTACAEYFRKRSRQGSFLSRLSAILERQPSALEGDETRADLLDALKDCLAALPEDSRGLLSRYYAEDEAVDRGESSVRMAVMRLRHGLRQCVLSRLHGSAP